MTESLAAGRFVLRPATAADTRILVDCRMAMLAAVFPEATGPLGSPDSAAELRDANERWMEEHVGRDFVAWIAEIDGRAVASAALLWFPHPPSSVNPIGLEAYILNVYTAPEARRQGLARALMQKLVAHARAAGVRRIWLRASDEGRPLYEDMGFRPGNYLQLTPD
jgi:GNAT superfamily N-acetyltransferase